MTNQQSNSPSAPEGPIDEDLGYDAAIAELEAILNTLESTTTSVDTLADRVKRAAALIEYCQARLDVVRADVTAVVDDLESST